ncbi:MAG: phosphoribosylformylglycinamidine cyclo-ligase [Zetaproteobacteria bacterium]|nr:phosphoribosylformylglycinamidine cyclo-ligase [Zetaproteobacteria bacterium]
MIKFPPTSDVVSPSQASYAASGVDISKADALMEGLRQSSSPTGLSLQPHGLGQLVEGIGGFAGCYATRFQDLEQPILVACTDGVGTKLNLATESGQLDDIGQDLVAMCLNDLYTQGATPLFFLDYFACSYLESEQFNRVLTSIQRALTYCETSLMGGETAELPGLFSMGHFDIAGFVVGVVDASQRLHKQQVQAGDLLVGWASSGFHSNGYSLVRKWYAQCEKQLQQKYLPYLLKPTKIYKSFLGLLQQFPQGEVRIASHITGGGVSDNLARVIPKHLTAQLQRDSIQAPAWMHAFAQEVGEDLMSYQDVFNCGIGWISVVSPGVVDAWMTKSTELQLSPVLLGKVTSRSSIDCAVVYI